MHSQLSESMEQEAIRVLHSTWSLGMGGVSRLILDNVSEMANYGIHGDICYFVPNDAMVAEFEKSGLAPQGLGHSRRLHGPRTLARLLAVIKHRESQVLHTNQPLDSFYGAIAASLARVPLVTTFHTTFAPGERYGEKRKLATTDSTWANRLVKRRTPRYIAVSRAVRDAQAAARSIHPESIEVIYPGIDVKRFEPEQNEGLAGEIRGELGLDRADSVLINVGRLHRKKGQQYLIPMMATLHRKWPHTHLLIVGDGEERKRLAREIAAAGLGEVIHLLGGRNDVPALLAMSDMFVFPSLHGEGLPVALIEASASALPIVAARSGPAEEVVVEGRSGHLVSQQEPELMARRVSELLQTTDRGRSLGVQGRTIAKNLFDRRATAKAHAELYESVLT